MKGRSGSIIIKQKEGKVAAEKKDGGGFFSKMATMFGCGKAEDKPADPKREVSASLITNGAQVRQSIDSQQIKQMKAEREAELKQNKK